MDAKIGQRVITPRHGKAVEVNALWYNALRVLADIEARAGRARRSLRLVARARAVRRSFEEQFWNGELGALHDVVGKEGPDPRCRPNQILALGLPFPLLPRAKALAVLATVEQKLLTPFGLRSLAREDPAYRPCYVGGVESRDSAYHQGTVWPWLLGPYADAVRRYRGEGAPARIGETLREVLENLHHAGLGTLSEIFDGDAPHHARGCIAQAWSVGELLRIHLDRHVRNGA
jgi:predicted glycogen debranching enzyme